MACRIYSGSDEHFQACAAYSRQCDRNGWIYCQPAAHMTYRVGRTVYLSNCNGRLATVQVYKDGRMRAIEVQP